MYGAVHPRLPAGRLIAVTSLMVVLASCATLSPEEAEQKRREIDAMSEAAITRLIESRPELKPSLDQAVGVAVADMSVTKIPVFGAGGGVGVIVDKRSNARTYVKVSRFEIGGGMGVQSFKVILLVQDPKLMDEGMSGFWHFDAGADVAAGEKSAEGSVASASSGYQVFRLADSGAIATVTVRTIRARPFLD